MTGFGLCFWGRMKSTRLMRLALPLSLVLSLAACSNYPLGMDKEQWQALSSDEQLAAKQQQAELDQARAQERAAQARARELELQHELALLEKRRQQAAYGDRLQCVLDPLEAKFSNRWRSAQPTAIDILVGDEVTLNLQHHDNGRVRYRQNAYGYYDGQVLTLCRYAQSGRSSLNSDSCGRILGNFGDFQRGLTQNFSQNDFIRGQARCQFVPDSSRRMRSGNR